MIKNPLNAIARHFAEQRFWRWATPLLAPGLAVANPTGADVVAGAVAITNTDPNTLTINQGSATAAINWQNFSVGSQEYVIFNQPSASALALNRVVGGTPSEIFGHLLANGRVFLINPNGILFGAGSRIDVGALVASTANISDADFAAGRYVFNNAGTSSISNAGNIIAGPGGFVVLAADSVTNTGLIQANLGQVVLGAGNAFTLDLTGEGLINFAVDQAALSAQSGVTNLGQLVADGGKVLMTAKTAADLARTVVNNQGLVQAHSISENDKGEIFLGATGGDIVNAGTLDAAGINGANGGTVSLVGNKAVKLASSSVINATGDGALATGGSVHVSGHTFAIRGLLNIGRGGKLVLDPYNVHITNGAGGNASTGTSAFISENFIEGQLQSGVNMTIAASNRITLDDLADDKLNGVDLAGGNADDGSLTLGIGFAGGGSSYGAGATSFTQGPGNPGGGINFMDANDTVIVGRRLKIIGGTAYGDLALGNLAAGSSIELKAPNGINVGNITAGNLASIYAKSGDVAIGDITVTGNGGNIGVNITALGSGAGMGHINAGDDTISVHNSSGAAYANINASKDITIDNLVVHGGGGSDRNDLPIRQLNVHVNAGGNLTVNAAALTTAPRHFEYSTGTSHGYAGHRKETADMGTGFASFNADGTVTLGGTGAGGREIRMETAGDATLNVGAASYLNHAGAVVLNNVNVIAHAATTHEDSLVYTNSYGSFGPHSGQVRRATTSHVYNDAAVAQGEINVFANGNVSVPTGGAVKVTADGDVDLNIYTAGQFALEGNLTLDALGGRAYGGSDWTAVDTTWSGAAIDSHGYHSYSDNNFGRADMYVQASGGMHIGGVLSVAGNGTASVDLWANEGSNLTVDGKISVQGNKGHYSSQSSGSLNGAQVWHQSQHGSHGDAFLELDASSGYVKIGTTGSLDVKDFGGGVPFGDADIQIFGLHGVNVEGQIHVTGSYGDFHTDYGSAHKSSNADYHVGAANLEASGWYNDVHVYGGAIIDVEGHGFAQMHALSQHAGVVLDGQITVHSEAATFTENQSHDSLSTYYNGSTWVPYYRHSENHGGGAGGSAFLGVGAYGGDLHIGGTVTVSAPINAKGELYAGAISAGMPHGIYVDSGAHLTVTATAANRFSDNLYNNPNPNSPYNSRSHYDGNEAYAALELHGDGVYVGSSASVSVTGDGSASIDLVSSRGRDVVIDGTLTATGNKANFNTSSYRNYGYQSTQSYASGFAGSATVHVDTYNSGSSYADVIVGPDGQILIQDHGGGDHGVAAELRVNAAGNIVIDGNLKVDGDRGRRQQSGSGHYYSNSYSGSSYADAGNANLDLNAGHNVYVSRSAAIDVHAYGDANAALHASNGDVVVGGVLHVKADHGISRGYQSPGFGGGAFALETGPGIGSSYSRSTFNSSYGAAHATLSANNGNVYLGTTSSSTGGAIIRHGAVTVQGAGSAGLDVNARYNVTDVAPVTVTTSRAIVNTGNESGHYVNTGTSAAPHVVPVVDNSFHQSQNAGDARVNMRAGYWLYGGDRGRLQIDAPIVITGAGRAWASFTGRGSSDSAGVRLNAPLTVTDIGGSRASGGITAIDRNSYYGHQEKGTVTQSDGNTGYGDAEVYFGASGAGDDIVVSGGGITIQAPGMAHLEMYATRDLLLNAPISITATEGEQFHSSSGKLFLTYYNGSHGDYSYASNSIVRSGDAQFIIDSARDLSIAAPVSVTGAGEARFAPSYYYGRFRNVTISAPLSVVDNGSHYKRNNDESWDILNPAGTGEGFREDYHWSEAGIAASYAHSGSATVRLPVSQGFMLTNTGSILVRGVEYASLNIENSGSPASGYGGIRLDGHVSVAATPNDYRYHSSSHFDSPGSNYVYHYDESSASGAAQAYVSGAGDIAVYGGIDLSGAGSVDLHISGRNIDIESPLVLTSQLGYNHWHWDWSSHSYGVGYDETYSSSSFQTSASAETQFNLAARQNLTIGAGGIQANAYGGVYGALTAGSGSSGDVTINAPISVRSLGVRTSSSGSHTDSSYNSTHANSSSHSDFSGNWASGDARLTISAYGYPGYGGHVTLTSTAPFDIAGYGSNVGLSVYGPNGITVGAPIHVTAQAGHSFDRSVGHSHSFSSSGSLREEFHSWSSTSTSDNGSAFVGLYAPNGVIDVGGAITVNGEGNANVTLQGQTSYTSSFAAYGVDVHAPISVNAGRGFVGSSWNSSDRYYTLSKTGSGSSAITTATLTSQSLSSGHSNDRFGNAGVQIYTSQGGIRIASPVNVAAAGSASFQAYGNGDVEIAAPIMVTATRGLTSGHSFYDSSYLSGSYRYHQAGGSHYNSSYGVARLTAHSRYGDLDVGAALTATGAGAARVDLAANEYNGSGSHALRLNAPIMVNASRGQYFYESASSSTVWQRPAGAGTSAGVPPVASSSGAVVVSHSQYHTVTGGSSGSAALALYAIGDIVQAPTAAIMVSGAGYANVDASAYNGNVNLQGDVSAISVAGSHFAASSGNSNNGLTSHGSNMHGSYGSAAITLAAYPRVSGSGSSFTVTGGNITANSLTATGAGNAQIQLNASSGGAIVVNGNLAADAGIGSFHSASFYRYDTSGAYHYHYANSSSGNVGYGSVYLNAAAGITVHGGVMVSGNGGATASFYASNGGVTVDGPVTVTSGIGHAAWAGTYDYTASSGYHNANTSHGVADVGAAQVTAQAYNGGNVTLGNVTATGFGYANVNLYASNGAVSAGSVAASAARAAGSSNYTNDYHPYPSYQQVSGGSSHWDRSQAYVDVNGASVTVNGGVTVTGAGHAQASLNANGDVAVTGILQVDAHRGVASGAYTSTTTYPGGSQYHYTSSYAGSNGFAHVNAGGYDISLGGVAATASGDVQVQLNAGNTVSVNGPVTLGASRGSSAGQSFNSYNNGAGSTHSDNSEHWNSSAGAARLLVTAPNGITLGGVTINANGDLSAQLYASSGAVQTGGLALDAQRGRYSSSYASNDSSPGRSVTDQGHFRDSLGNVDLNVYGYNGITVSGPVTVAGHGRVDARFSASNASADISVSGPVSVVGQTAAIDEFYSHDRTGTTSSHSSTVVTGSYGTASLQIYAWNGNVTVGGMSISADSAALAQVHGMGNLSLGNVLVSGDTVDDSFRASIGALDFGNLDLSATLAGVTIQTASGTGVANVGGNLSVTAGGAITQTSDLVVAGVTTLSASAGDITLDNAGNDFIGAVSMTATNATLADVNGLVLGTSALTGDLSLTAAGPITQTGTLSVGGTTVLNAGANAVTLASTGNDFVGAVSTTATDATLVDANALVLGASTLSGNLSATAAGPITQTGALSVGGATSLSASTVTLTDTGNDFVGSVSMTATDATLVDSNALALAASTLSGNLSVTAAGPITQAGALSVAGTTTLAAGTGNITLANAGNTFGGSVGITSAANATLVDSNALALAASTLTGNLSVTAAGPITQTGALSVGGTTSLNAGANAITLGDAGNDFGGAVGVTASDATLVDASDLTLGTSALTGNLSVTAAGAVTQTGGLNVGGATSLSANTVTLTSTGNNFAGAVDITATDATLVNSNAFTFGASTLTGNLSVSAAGPITQAGALSVAGTTSLAAGANAVTLANAGNDFGGAVGITASDATLVDANDLTLGAFTITNTLLASAGGDIAIAGATTANLVDLTATTGSVTDNGVGGGSITTGAMGIKAGVAIDFGATALSVGTGVAPFGDDPQAAALLAAQAPAGFFGNLTPNGAFAAPSVTFGTLHLTGNAIFIQADAISYAGAITMGTQSLPPSGFVVHYDTFTPDAAVHVVGTLPGTVVAGDAYYDAGDFAYPGTTYLFGNSNSNSPMQIGENGPPSAGSGGDDNFFFMTDNDVTVITPIPTTGQVMVIRPHTVVSDFDFIPIAADWETTTTDSSAFGDDDEKKEEKLEHEEQTQTAGAGESEEGQIDSESSSNLECH